MSAVELTVATNGPFFDAKPSVELARGIHDGLDAAGDEAVRIVQAELDDVLVNPTGRYRRQINYSLRTDDSAAFIGDNRAVYGPWLDGSGSRNARSRFKGYAHWRRAMQRMEQRAPDLVEDHLDKAVARLS